MFQYRAHPEETMFFSKNYLKMKSTLRHSGVFLILCFPILCFPNIAHRIAHRNSNPGCSFMFATQLLEPALVVVFWLCTCNLTKERKKVPFKPKSLSHGGSPALMTRVSECCAWGRLWRSDSKPVLDDSC